MPFFHDTTTKNVAIAPNGDPAGIVDVDSLCFGDPLWTVALTRMALLAHRFDTAYIAHWERRLNLSPIQRRVSVLYSAVHCVAFLSALGQAFNNEAAPPVDEAYRRHSLVVLDALFHRGRCKAMGRNRTAH